VDQVFIGLGYTAVTTSAGDIGIAATGVAMDACCAGRRDMVDHEGEAAIDLLQQLKATDPMARTLALALVNALNHRQVQDLPEDADNRLLYERFGILSGARVAMVGYFPPLVQMLEDHGVPLTVIDDAKGVGDKAAFYRRLGNWADVLLITATSIINNSTETILSHAAPSVKSVLLGPTTPMVPAAVEHLPIHMLAGTAITHPDRVLKVVRHGGGARSLKTFTRKIYQFTGSPR
jgi:uncharacterized protein (DUF4213/DUF364 family)